MYCMFQVLILLVSLVFLPNLFVLSPCSVFFCEYAFYAMKVLLAISWPKVLG